MTRVELLKLVEVSRPGLEIGALDTPIVTRDMGPVEYVDFASTDHLRALYAGTHVHLERLVEVDHVWGASTLADCVGAGRRYAYVLAAHVIEHVPDLIGWLNEIADVLEPGAIAGFVVPDKRHTFDALRRTTSPHDLVDAHLRRLRRPGARQVFDHFYNFREAGQEHVQDTLGALKNATLAEDGVYIDTHCWVFTPASLLGTLRFMSDLGKLPFELAALQPTEAGQAEFLLALRRLPASFSCPAWRRPRTVRTPRRSCSGPPRRWRMPRWPETRRRSARPPWRPRPVGA
jgi:hypothetical protein